MGQDDAVGQDRAIEHPDEPSLSDLRLALDSGTTTSEALVRRCLDRIERLDRNGPKLNAMPVPNPGAIAEARASDERRRANTSLGPLDGIPYAVKDNMCVAGLTVAAGSPAFAELRASGDSFVVERLRAAGAVLIGKTTMPPMADGGMQRGLYGRAENPYNPSYLAAAFASGSSQGSAVALAADLCAFSLGTETVSSGRSPASNNAVVAYTPSRGLISLRGVWPLFAVRDVITPYTRSVADLLVLLDVLLTVDPHTRGDLWRAQTAVPLPVPLRDAPLWWTDLALDSEQPLGGVRLGVPRMYTGDGASMGITTRPSVLALWARAAARLERLGAELVPTDFPLVERYEGGRAAGEHLDALGVLPPGWLDAEFNDFLASGWDDFLRDNGDPSFPTLGAIDADLIFPRPPGALPDRYDEVDDYDNRYRAMVDLARHGVTDPLTRPDLAPGLRALEALRTTLLDDWMDAERLDALVFPANADIGPADADVDVASADRAWANGVVFSNGNYAIRHLGVPTLTVPMGITADIGVPVGLTFAGRAYDDRRLVELGLAFESPGSLRVPPPLG